MSGTILIVDDEIELREAIAFDFRRKKFNVLLAASGNEAIEIVKANSSIDIVLTDVRMPDGDGVELLEKIKARSTVLPVVMFITGFADITVEEAYDKGADAVFAKPFDRKMLFEAVQRAIQPSENLARKGSRVHANLSVSVKFLKSNITLHSQALNIGRGGMFVALGEHFPAVQEEVEFKLESAGEPAIEVAGKGIVRWVRRKTKEEFPPGCGVEFLNLDRECVINLVDLVNFLKTRSFIPRK